MKRTALLLIGTLCFTAATMAQTTKGDWLVGGSMTINTTKDNSDFSLLPAAGHFFAKNFAAGAQVTLSFGKTGDTKYSDVGIGPFARYYFDLKNPNFKPLLHADFNVVSERNKTNGISVTNTVTSFFIGAGGAYFINRNVALEGVAGYNSSKFENNDANGGFRFRLGFQVHLLGSEVKSN